MKPIRFSKLSLFMMSFFLIGAFSQKAFSESDIPMTKEDVRSAFENDNFDLRNRDLSGANLGETQEWTWILTTLGITGAFPFGLTLGAGIANAPSYFEWPFWAEASLVTGLALASLPACIGYVCFIGSKVARLQSKGYAIDFLDLRKANLEGAIYNEKTIFPKGFNPEKAGMIPKCKTAFLNP